MGQGRKGQVEVRRWAVLCKLRDLGDNELAQFLMLCSVAHYGTNHYGSSRVDQKKVVQLAGERGVNYGLIEAQARYDLCAKKYKTDHRIYLEAIKNGKSAMMPVVYERSSKSGQTPVVATAED